MAIVSSFPLALTGVQRTFYLFPSFPFYAMFFGVLIILSIRAFEFKRLNLYKSIFNYMSIVLLVVSITFSIFSIGKIKRDVDYLEDVYALEDIIECDSNYGCSTVLYDKWNVQFYLLRHYNVSLFPKRLDSTYYITLKGEVVDDIIMTEIDSKDLRTMKVYKVK